MLSSAYFCVLAYVKICHAFPAEGRRYGARLSQPSLNRFVYHNHFQAAFQAASGRLEEFACRRHSLQTPLPAQPAAGAVFAPRKLGCAPKQGCDGSLSADPLPGELLLEGCSAAWHQGAAAKRGGGRGCSLGGKGCACCLW